MRARSSGDDDFQRVDGRSAAGKPTLLSDLFFAEHTEFPAVTIRIMEPKAHVFRAWRLRTDFIAWIFNIDANGFQMRQRLSQSRYVRQMKRHVIYRFRRRLPFK